MELLFLTLIFAIYIFVKNHKRLNVRLLTTSLSIFIIYAIAHNAVNSEEYTLLKTLLFNHFTPFYLLAGPSFYFFIKSTIDKNFKLKKSDLLHLIPFIIQIIGISEYSIMPWDKKVDLVTNFFLNPEMQSKIKVNIFFASETNYIIRFFHLITYFIGSLILLKNETNKKTKTLKRVTIIIISMIVLYYIHILLILSNGIYNSIFIKVIINLDILLLFALVLEFIKAPELYLNSKKIKKAHLVESPYVKDSKNNFLNDSDREAIAEKIDQIKQDEAFFINPKNNFRDFASLINFPNHLIRAYLKTEETSYIDIKNKIRLTFAKRVLQKTKLTYNLDYVAEKSGFNSRSNFYTIFKKYEKCTPREYLKKKTK